jgi:hypothetical protein
VEFFHRPCLNTALRAVDTPIVRRGKKVRSLHACRRSKREGVRDVIASMAMRENDFEVRFDTSGGRDAPILGPMQGVVGRAKRGASKAAKAHVSYLAREARQASPVRTLELERQVDYLSREAAQGRAQLAFYNGDLEHVDAKALTSGWAEDVRHFRLIISAEDGAALGDLKPFVREVMGDLEVKLGTSLEWAALDHWDTDNPHTHVLVRGRRADGQDLAIPNRTLTQGIRARWRDRHPGPGTETRAGARAPSSGQGPRNAPVTDRSPPAPLGADDLDHDASRSAFPA